MPIYVFTEDHKATTISTVIESVEEYNRNFRELDDTITFKTLIAKPAEGTDVIPVSYTHLTLPTKRIV